ncbi:MAG: ABC transporter substrate-binding protein [Deltaproteobacteria bacterium]|nr:ABC transporter substrate-binding protein [Deltaproteobacteria bacterium]MBI3078894.1 ABC transporter substrate-binding protein [Deltaproteobacteria bacterium]
MVRHRALRILALAALLAASPAAWAADRLITPYQSLSIGGSVAFWVARDAGFFERNGLEVTLVFVEGSPKIMQVLLAGESQIVDTTGPALLNARAGGSPVVLIAGSVNVMPYYLIVHPSISSPADLKGKVGANHIPGTAADTVIRIGLKALGLDPDRDVSLRAIGNIPMRLQALAAGFAQFMVGQDLEAVQAKRLGFKVLVDYVAARTPFQQTGVATTESYVRAKRDVVLRYVKAFAQALHYLRTNREGSIAIIQRYARYMSPDVVGPAYDAARRLYNETPMPTIEGLEFIAKELANRNPKVRGLDVRTAVDLQFVKELEQTGFLKSLKGS